MNSRYMFGYYNPLDQRVLERSSTAGLAFADKFLILRTRDRLYPGLGRAQEYHCSEVLSLALTKCRLCTCTVAIPIILDGGSPRSLGGFRSPHAGVY